MKENWKTRIKTNKCITNLEYYTNAWEMGDKYKIKALKWIELSIASGSNTLETFE